MRTVLSMIFSVMALAAFAGAASAQDREVLFDETLPSGVRVQILSVGAGISPSATSSVTVHYRGTLVDGKEFDSSYSRGNPATFTLDRVIRCWTEGLQKIPVGAQARLTCPPATAYGQQGARGIPPNSTLIFEVELLGIN